MKVNPLPPVRSKADAAEKLFCRFHWAVCVLAAASWALATVLLFAPPGQAGRPGWPDAVLVLSAALTTLISLSRRLPGQNVLLAAGGVAVLGGLVHALGAVAAVPFGPFGYTDRAGPRLFNTLAWPVPFLWIIVILNSRGVARLILRPWRRLRHYGYWLIGVTVALTVLWVAALDPFAVAVKHYWLWHPTRLPFTWFGAPVTNFLGWLVTALLILAFVTPALIDKRPKGAGSRPPDYHPLVVWLLALAWFGIGAATAQLWPAVIYTATVGGIVAFLAIRGARW